ncbi:MAG: PQQ-binding-like beta-propeller repeat protein, partial [Thermoanaerobaculia bacterium]
LLLAAGAGPAAEAAASDWPQFRGPGGQGVSADKGLPVAWGPEENLVWKTELPGRGASSPILSGPSIYLTSYTGFGDRGGDIAALERQLVCLQRADGRIAWTREVAARQPEEEKNREGHGYATSTPLADGERVYVFFGKTGVLAFDLQGKELWRAEVGERTSGWGSAASPVFHQELVIVNASVESESLVALDRKSGKEVWRAGGIKDAWNTPILARAPDGRVELIIAVMQKLLAFDPVSGKPLWSCRTDIDWYMAPSLVAHDGIVYCVGGRSGGSLAVRLGGSGDVTATHRLWTGRKGSNVTSPLYHEGHLYWMHENLGIAYCAEAKSGRMVYERRVEDAGQVYASPVLAGGRLYYLTRSGRGLVLPARPEYQLLAANELERRGAFNSSPAVGEDRLYLRSDRFLYCIGKS